LFETNEKCSELSEIARTLIGKFPKILGGFFWLKKMKCSELSEMPRTLIGKFGFQKIFSFIQFNLKKVFFVSIFYIEILIGA
jgi:hypothetical protein